MAYQIQTDVRPAHNQRDGIIYVAQDQSGATGIEVWPALGFSCFRWYTTVAGKKIEWLYSGPLSPNSASDGGQVLKSTRIGIPILFPFPNRIRDGRFTWDGKSYQLPLIDPARKNAIHGFACHHPWRVVDQGADDQGAWLTGEFQTSRDAPEDLQLWPADNRIRVTYRLQSNMLRVEAVVDNPDQKPLPFGLGYHPYFALPATEEETSIQVPAQQYWELEETLPTGRKKPVHAGIDLRQPRQIKDLYVDDVLTDLQLDAPQANGLCYYSCVHSPRDNATLKMFATPVFRDMVVFIPPHRGAVCLEPYTCVTDAINLQQQGVDAGLRILKPGEEWSAVVELAIEQQPEYGAG